MKIRQQNAASSMREQFILTVVWLRRLCGCVAALPLDVRKGSAFPGLACDTFEATPPMNPEAQPRRNLVREVGKPEAFRTSGGRAVSNDSRERRPILTIDRP